MPLKLFLSRIKRNKKVGVKTQLIFFASNKRFLVYYTCYSICANIILGKFRIKGSECISESIFQKLGLPACKQIK